MKRFLRMVGIGLCWVLYCWLTVYVCLVMPLSGFLAFNDPVGEAIILIVWAGGAAALLTFYGGFKWWCRFRPPQV